MSAMLVLSAALYFGPGADVPPEPCALEEECEAPVVDVVQGSGGFVSGANESLEQEKAAERAANDANASGSPRPQVGVWMPPASASAPEEETGPLVCMVIDDGPQVAWMPSCDEVVPEPEDEEEAEDEDAPAEEESEPVIITVTRSDFAELPLDLPTVHLQPERDWFLVNMDTLVYTDGAPQMLETTVLDVPVRVRATPVEFSWDFGDGSSPLVTTEAGAPWPAEDIAHVYQREAENVAITLTTTWSGEFQVGGQGPWIPIAGTTTTQSQSAPFRIDTAETRLVADD